MKEKLAWLKSEMLECGHSVDFIELAYFWDWMAERHGFDQECLQTELNEKEEEKQVQP